MPARNAIAVLAAVVALAAIVPSAAFGHAAFVESSPEPGTRLEDSPERLELSFTEPLIRKLTKATIVDARSGEPIPASVSFGRERRLVLEPHEPLGTAAYRVNWHTVSTEDGHALEGSFSFGVRADALGGESTLEQSPLARDGWVRVVLRGLFYGALLYFAAGLLIAALLSRGGAPAGWLAPPAVADSMRRRGLDPDALVARAWQRTLDAGWVAGAAGAGAAIAEARDAGGSLSLDGLANFLLSNVAGLGRVGAVLGVVVALVLAERWRLGAAATVALVFLSIAYSGHANSADERGLAIVTDWLHLAAAAVWVGGIAQIAVAWLPATRGAPRGVRTAVMRAVLARFGSVALPAFLVVAGTGLANALIQLGEPPALWQTAYGRVLAVKIALVGLIVMASYFHALRIRPRLLAANPHPTSKLERRHWRLLGSEPALGAAVVVAAALLVAFPLPPRQLGEGDEAEAAGVARTCDPCPQRRPKQDELAVADNAGSTLVAAWLRREGDELTGEVRLYGLNMTPRDASAEVAGAKATACGKGCLRFTLPGRPATLRVRVPEKGRTYTARMPARWDPDGSRKARALLGRAQRAMRELESLRQYEDVTSGPGSSASTRYELQAPDRFSYVTNRRAETVVIGKRQWYRADGLPWQQQEFGGGLPFRTRRWFRWTTYARSVRLLGAARERGRELVELALMDEATPVWFRLKIDRASMRVLRVRMIADGHFMNQRYTDFNEPLTIEPPARDG